MVDHQPRPDDVAHQDNVFMGEVAEVNTLLGRYVLRFLDADAGRAVAMRPCDERALADQVTAVAAGLRARALRRERQGDPPPLVVRTPTVD